MLLPMTARRFTYWQEPLCLLAVLLYSCNHFWLKACVADKSSFVHCYLSDALCLPVLLPITLWLQRRLGLRAHDHAPSYYESAAHWALWTCCFELLGPAIPALAPGAVADPWDAVAYGAGGLLVTWSWRRGATDGAGRAPLARRNPGIAGRAVVALAVSGLVLCAYRVGAAAA
ncbi:MAG: hypothetical protein CMJ88_13145 [Planctomycetes bacterium]|nr:hypothetical protein [Planctomycetota bacterium]